MSYKISKYAILLSFLLFMHGCASEEGEWQKAKSENKIETYKEFLNNYPQSKHAKEIEILVGNYAVIVVEDSDSIFWAIPVSAMTRYEEDILEINPTVVACGEWGNNTKYVPKYSIDMVFVYTSGSSSPEISLQGTWNPPDNKTLFEGCMILLQKMILNYRAEETSFKSFRFWGGSGNLVFIQKPTKIVLKEMIDKIKKENE
ncbi:MAG: hypothetical protein A2V66_12175 [Ignavibacteria bacterium RBG_13_36_8]|nr:MAG: hypothetical protein A2V66_12175 [Ignavibacteria bacterium RBG_13_36_8]